METLTADDIRQYAKDLNHSAKRQSLLGTANTNWQDEIYQAAFGTDHNFNVAGGTRRMPYRVSMGYTFQDGTIKQSNLQLASVTEN